jgi:hypothetical protein
MLHNCIEKKRKLCVPAVFHAVDLGYLKTQLKANISHQIVRILFQKFADLKFAALLSNKI